MAEEEDFSGGGGSFELGGLIGEDFSRETLVLNRTRVFGNTWRQARCSARVRLSRLNVAARFAADAGPMEIQ